MRISHSLVRAFFLITITIGLLGGCGNAQKPIVGKWEMVSSKQMSQTLIASVYWREGDLAEFYPDGTVSIGSNTAKYTNLDATHLKFDAGIGPGHVFEQTLSGDDLTLQDSDRQYTFKRYKELQPNTDTLTGKWVQSSGDGTCLRGVGKKDHPDILQFQQDGTFAGEEQYGFIIVSDRTVLNGHYQLQGNRLQIAATHVSDNQSVSGEGNCIVSTLTNTRLTLKDAQNKTLLYVRTTK